ncbi:hypothetical protein JB92DRAFT_2838657 [Gautieria morchelliformis]|nr:hypothetical protein JB92DRAFT_2838657 [Gautieria morchelliformis]
MAMSWLNGSYINQPEDSNSPIKPQGPRSKLQWHVPMIWMMKERVWILSRGGFQHFSRVDVVVVRMIRMFCKLQSLGWPARSSPQHSQESGTSLSTIRWTSMKNEKFPHSLLSSDQDQSNYMDVDDEDVDCSLETLRISVILEMFDMTLESCCGSGNGIAGFESHW